MSDFQNAYKLFHSVKHKLPCFSCKYTFCYIVCLTFAVSCSSEWFEVTCFFLSAFKTKPNLMSSFRFPLRYFRKMAHLEITTTSSGRVQSVTQSTHSPLSQSSAPHIDVLYRIVDNHSPRNIRFCFFLNFVFNSAAKTLSILA